MFQLFDGTNNNSKKIKVKYKNRNISFYTKEFNQHKITLNDIGVKLNVQTDYTLRHWITMKCKHNR